jgi:hypothetical protein
MLLRRLKGGKWRDEKADRTAVRSRGCRANVHNRQLITCYVHYVIARRRRVIPVSVLLVLLRRLCLTSPRITLTR